MSNFNWCHGPECHTKHTVDRVRGVKGSKVLRTRKVRVYSNNNGWYSYFCSQRCYDDFTNKQFKITFWAKKHKKHITRNAKWTDLCKYFTSKSGTPCITYYDEDAHGYRTATTTWKVRL